MALEGLWQNAYGSQLDLVAAGAELHGHYRSTTGSTGIYRVTGFQGTANEHNARAISFAIAWHSIDGGPGDESWAWTSSFSGQYIVTDGDEQLVLNHLLIASTPLSGLCEPGIFIDKLIYRRSWGSIDVAETTASSTSATIHSFGEWRAVEGTHLKLKVCSSAKPARLRGTFQFQGRNLGVTGFAGWAVDGVANGRTALSIVAIDQTDDVAIALSGWIQHDTSACALQLMTSRATAPTTTYLQTTVTPIWFERTDPSNSTDRTDAKVA